MLLVQVLFGLIGFVGWKVYENNNSKKAPSPTTTTESATMKDEPKKTGPVIPEGFVEHKNQELGLKFAYPQAWGEAKDDSNSDVVFSAPFTNLKKANDSPVEGKTVSLYANNGQTGF